MKKIGKFLVSISVIVFLVALATANITATFISMAGITYSTALANGK